jgi:hypothetical protein
VRAAADETFEQLYARMTVRQKDAMTVVREARRDWQLLTTRVGSAQAALYDAVVKALQAGVPVRVMGEELELSVSRVYQIRDEVAEHRE